MKIVIYVTKNVCDTIELIGATVNLKFIPMYTPNLLGQCDVMTFSKIIKRRSRSSNIPINSGNLSVTGFAGT